MAEGDAENPLFASPMQLLRPDAKHHFLEPVPETMEALARVDCPVNIITGACVPSSMGRVARLWRAPGQRESGGAVCERSA